MAGRGLRALVLAVCATLLAGCATTPAPMTTLPDGIAVSVYQTRLDRGDRQLEIRVVNDTDSDLHVTRAEYNSSQLDGPALWIKDSTTIRAGLTVDLRVELPAARCDYEGTPTSEVTLGFALEDGDEVLATITPEDPIGQVPGLTKEDCVAEAVAELATLRVAEQLDYDPGTRTPAVLELRVEPTGAQGELVFESVSNTTLFAIVPDPRYTSGFGTPFGPGSDTGVLRIGLAATLCQAHAIADDKRGTIFPLNVAIDGERQILYYKVSDAMRSQLYTFIDDFCLSRELVPGE